MDLKTFLVDNILEYTDRMSMATALEVRVPLLDTAFVELSLNAPFAYKFRNGESKAILIDAFAEFFPPEARHAPKTGLQCPSRTVGRKALRPLLRCQPFQFAPTTRDDWGTMSARHGMMEFSI